MPHEKRAVELDCPAKLNLTLGILGPRDDGFHALHSIVAQTVFGDRLAMEWDPEGKGSREDVLEVRGATLPAGENTVQRAVALFREVSGLEHGRLRVTLHKAIPAGAGLGGGSSDAVAALKALARIFAAETEGLDWTGLAARIGSDCPLFLSDQPVLMRGRGEEIEPLASALADRLRGRPVILFKPGFAIDTSEAYRRLAAGRFYTPVEEMEALVENWRSGGAGLPVRHNDFERLVEFWLPSVAVLLRRLREEHGLDARMSGSGSACFVFPGKGSSAMTLLSEELEMAWGPFFWMEETLLK